MSEHQDHGDDLHQPGDYLTGDDATARAIPQITGIPRPRQPIAPLGTRAPRQRDRRAE